MELADILESICQTAEGVMAVDAENRIIAWNHSAEQLLGFTAEEVLCQKCDAVLKGMDGNGNPVCFAGCTPMVCVRLRTLIHHFDYQVLGKDGRRHWLDVSFFPLRDGDGEILALVHLFHPADGLRTAKQLVEELLNRLSIAPTSGPDPTDDGQLTTLTSRELEILQLLCDGAGTLQIAVQLCITVKTARNHIGHILEKLGVHTRLEAVARVSDGPYVLHSLHSGRMWTSSPANLASDRRAHS